MAQDGGGGAEKTERASPKKRADERKKGNIFMSKDITTVISLVASFFIISLFIGGIIDNVMNIFRNMVLRMQTVQTVDLSVMMEIYRELMLFIATSLLPAIIIIGMVSVIIVLMQSKFLWATDRIKFKLSRINPLSGIKRMFALRSLVELVKSLIKVAILIYILYFNIVGVINDLPGMIDWDIMQAVRYAGDRILALIIAVGIAFAGVAALDFLYQRWEYEKNIRMTKQEVKDEYKQMEGNPEIKSARRQKQREFAMSRMMQAVEEADVVVRNPTHFAVALKYKLDVDVAPIVVAKGKDNIALRIIEEAEKHGIDTVENRTLARGLYDAAEIDQVIPGEFFQPVAELLAWLYSTKEGSSRPNSTVAANQPAERHPVPPS